LAKATKGIRISELAKELGVTAKSIVERIHAEGVESDKDYKTSSTIPLGLAETVKEWRAGGELKAVDESNVAVAERPKRAAPKKKKDAAADEHAPAADESAAVAEPAAPTPQEDTQIAAEVAEPADDGQYVEETTESPTGEAEDDGSAQASDQMSDAPTSRPAIKPVPMTPGAAQTRGPTLVPQAPPKRATGSGLGVPAFQARPPKPAAPLKPAATAAPAAMPTPIAPPAGGAAAQAAAAAAAKGAPVPHVARPTVSIDSMAASSVVQRLVTPSKAVVKGPALIREEKPDVVSAPRPRGPRPGTGGPGTGAGPFNPMRPRGGGGVVVRDDGSAEEEAEAKKKAAARAPGAVRRKGTDGRRGLAEEKLKEFTEADLIERRDRLNEATRYRSGVDQHMRKSLPAIRGRAESPSERGGPIQIEEPITVKTLSNAIGIKSNDIMKALMKRGVFATVNQALTFEVAESIATDAGLELELLRAPTLEETMLAEFQARPRDEANLTLRPPVVTILGHVDHGKTSLLDKIRSANVAAGESGGITQHIAAFSVELQRPDGKKRVTFIDTPGHQAFTSMRARGANMTDVVVLVVDAAQGIQPQTIESINHARAAGVPIVVAMNKIDLPDANPDMVMGQMATHDLNPVAWGGQTEMVQTSGKTGQGIEDLIEILDLQSQILELKADPTAPARGIVIEARVDPGLGSVATVLVQDGTLKVGDVVLAGQGYGKIRQLRDSNGKFIQEAGPSTPVLIAGLSSVPNAGDKFFVTTDVDRAEKIAEERHTLARSQLVANSGVSLESLFATMKQGDIKTINLIIKADVAGSVETLTKTVIDYNTAEVQVKVIHSAVGPINESDVELAAASGAVIIGFHVVADAVATALAETRHVEIRTYRVIYEIFDDLKKALSGMLEPEIREKHHGWIEIRQVFKVSRIGSVAGCYVTEGHVQRGSKIRLVRDDKVITEGVAIDTLRRVKEDVKEVKTGLECGIKLAGYDDIKVGDKLEAYIREEIKRVL
jgi:translation initiation factor IF-2